MKWLLRKFEKIIKNNYHETIAWKTFDTWSEIA